MSTAKVAAPSAVTVPSLQEKKQRGQKLVMLTAYDFVSAKLGDDSGADILLVGDSLGMVIQGHGDTLRVTLDQMVYHCAIVSRVCLRALVVADMPYLTYHTGPDDAVRNAGRCVQEGGVQGVKIEGGEKRAPIVEHLVKNEIPVMGHIGLTPQSIHVLGGFKVQGKGEEARSQLVRDAISLQEAGAFSVVLECIPAEIAGEITERLSIPTIGIGAGLRCDGQVLVFHDLLGLYGENPPRFVRRYANLSPIIKEALSRFREDVLSGQFPSDGESFHIGQGVPGARGSSGAKAGGAKP